jgi:hypothetical protein
LSNKLEVFPAALLGEEEEKKKNKCSREGKKKKKERFTVRKERDWGKLGIEEAFWSSYKINCFFYTSLTYCRADFLFTISHIKWGYFSHLTYP